MIYFSITKKIGGGILIGLIGYLDPVRVGGCHMSPSSKFEIGININLVVFVKQF